ncbi:MAG: hypothetical protein FJ271_23660 [Planctomycetes bacterium]|nr:hypothetical protein [Planctomycetota bacterium]
MPIRFRCAYCNQLMGIARRKAGSIIRCPKCAGQVIVPSPVPEPSSAGAQPLPPPGGGPALFEGSDIEKLFGTQPAAAPPAPLPPLPNPSPFAQPQPYIDIESLPMSPAPSRTPGIFLTPGKLTVLSVLMVLLLGMAFFLGLMVGRS